MRARRLALTLAAAAAAPALARAAAPPAPDARIRTVAYDPGRVVRLVGRPHAALEVILAPSETIQHLALGDAGAWQVAAEGNLLFLRPRRASAASNLIVATRGPDGARSYVFELSARPTRAALYALRFRYPAPPAAEAAQAAARARQVLDLRLDLGPFTGPRNLAWSAQGPADLAPAEVTDNGRFTVLRFAAGQPLPAISAVDARGTETLTDAQTRGEFLVIPGVPKGLRLRRGRAVLCLTNDAWRPLGPAPGETAAPQVARTAVGSAP